MLQERRQIKGYTESTFGWIPMGEEEKESGGRKERRERGRERWEAKGEKEERKKRFNIHAAGMATWHTVRIP